MKQRSADWTQRKPNPVAKHSAKLYRAATFADRQKAQKRGYQRCQNSFGWNQFGLGQDDSKRVSEASCLPSF